MTQSPPSSPVTNQNLQTELANLNAQLAGLQAQIAAKQATFPSVPPRADRGTSNNRPDPDTIAGMLFVLTLAFVIPASIAWARRLFRGGAHAASPPLAEIAPRLDRLEQAIDSIAIEVERISEGQRFVTKVLAEQQPIPLPPSGTR